MKQITGFSGYSIDEYGNVFIEKSNRFKKPFISKNGYLMVSLSKNNKQKNYTVHGLVLTAFFGQKPSKKHQCMHIDGNKQNNFMRI